MSLPLNWPTSLDSFANPSPTQETDDPGFELDLVVSRIHTLLMLMEAKVGIGAGNPPATAAVLRRTATGASGWGAVQGVDVSAGGTANQVLATADGTNTGMQKLTTAMIAANVLNQANAVAAGPSADQAWSTAGWSAINQLTQTITVASTSLLLLFGSMGAYHSVANGRNQLRFFCTTTGNMLGFWSPDVAHVTAGGKLQHHIAAVVAAPAGGSLTIQLQAQAVDAGTILVYANSGYLFCAELKRGGV